MRTTIAVRRKSFWLVITIVLALTFVLSACGSSQTTSTGSGSTASPTAATPTTLPNYGTQHGCPSNAVFVTAPAAANVVVHLTDSRKPVIAHKGDVIEFQLPFGQQWQGPKDSQGNLQLQGPAGYAWNLSKACIWRFTALQAGKTELDFTARAICIKAHLCPEYVIETPFTINVQ